MDIFDILIPVALGGVLIALLGGHVTMQFGGISSALPYIRDGKVRAIAVTGDHRDPNLPDVPTFTEAGLKGADVESIWGLHAPAGTPIELRRIVREAAANAAPAAPVVEVGRRGHLRVLRDPEPQEPRE